MSISGRIGGSRMRHPVEQALARVHVEGVLPVVDRQGHRIHGETITRGWDDSGSHHLDDFRNVFDQNFLITPLRTSRAPRTHPF